MPLGLLYNPAYKIPGSSSLTRMVRQLQHFMGMAWSHGMATGHIATIMRLAVPCNLMLACTAQNSDYRCSMMADLCISPLCNLGSNLQASPSGSNS